MYIPYEDIQYYNNALYFESKNPIDVIKEDLLEEATSAANDSIAEAAEKALGIGRQLSFVMAIIGIANDIRKTAIENAMKTEHQEAQQLATDRRTGMFVIFKKTVKYAYVRDFTWPGGGYWMGPLVVIEVKYVAADKDYSI